MYFIAFLQQKFRKISPILSSNTCDQCRFFHVYSFLMNIFLNESD